MVDPSFSRPSITGLLTSDWRCTICAEYGTDGAKANVRSRMNRRAFILRQTETERRKSGLGRSGDEMARDRAGEATHSARAKRKPMQALIKSEKNVEGTQLSSDLARMGIGQIERRTLRRRGRSPGATRTAPVRPYWSEGA